ncbi:DUF2066 domain-containing protein [Arsukibacterium ikkense]|uniref:DUF2066 domain-containing protein n=1 Tax=Arsukibacterium ikkense TaxID=336831 RepID=UPI00069A6F34|nr:DUF2066 domain-containing protein [Arsukibacterium ikkense]
MRQGFQPMSILLAGMLLLAGNPLAAVEVDALYLADVSADQTQRQWQNNALAQVITRLTGINNFSDYPEITRELNNAGRYVKQFESHRHNGDTRLKVLLDASLINPLLQQQGIAIWGAHRPEILVWIVQQQAGERRFLRQPEHELVKLLLPHLAENGIPVTLPLYDIEDLSQLSETDVWAGFWQSINQASSRYRPDRVMTIAFDEVNRDGATLQRLSWQRQSTGPGTEQNRIIRNEVTAVDHLALVQAFSTTLTRELAAEQAVLLQPQTQTFQLEVENLNTLADVVAVERLIGRVLGVASVTLSQFSANRAQFAVELQIELAQLSRILQWEPSLQISEVAAGREGGIYLGGIAPGLRPVGPRSEAVSSLNMTRQVHASYRFIRR